MEERGILKVWNDQKGFGFIAPVSGGPDVFAHISVVRGDCRPVVGNAVLYVAVRDANGRLCAGHVRLDAPMMLDRPAIRRRPQPQIKAPTPSKALLRPAEGKQYYSRSGPIRQLGFKLMALLLLVGLPMWGCLQVLLERHSLFPLLAYSLLSLVTFFLYWNDKQSAIKGRRRTPENTLHLCELAGGLCSPLLWPLPCRRAAVAGWQRRLPAQSAASRGGCPWAPAWPRR